jgi:hypothetical protein
MTKRLKSVFYKCVLEFDLTTINGLGRTKLFKSLYPNLHHSSKLKSHKEVTKQ